MFVKRTIEQFLKIACESFPAIIVTGPRQSGKTTLLKELFPEADFVTFDDPVMQNFIKTDPDGFIAKFNEKVTILDEIQYVPEFFSYLKIAIDKNRKNYGKWLLTGSQQFNMMNEVSDSLAGRVAIINLLPFCYKEQSAVIQKTIEEIIWYGAYPEVVLNPEIRDLWLSSYIRTYMERDVRQIINVQDLLLFQTFIALCAANHSQELNIAAISRDCGVSQPTINRWISILNTSFIAYLLKPFHTNLGKRVIKTPKFYFVDSAIAAYLTRQGNPESLFNASMGGAFFEGFIIIETLKSMLNKGKNGELFYWRSHDGIEVDLIIELNGKLHAIEIKKTQTPTAKHAESLEKFISLAGKNVENAFVVCNIQATKPLTRNVSAISWIEYLERIESIGE